MRFNASFTFKEKETLSIKWASAFTFIICTSRNSNLRFQTQSPNTFITYGPILRFNFYYHRMWIFPRYILLLQRPRGGSMIIVTMFNTLYVFRRKNTKMLHSYSSQLPKWQRIIFSCHYNKIVKVRILGICSKIFQLTLKNQDFSKYVKFGTISWIYFVNNSWINVQI